LTPSTSRGPSSARRSAPLVRAFGAALKRPRLSYNVAIYHRTLGEVAGGA
jgi:hypothetical protein